MVSSEPDIENVFMALMHYESTMEYGNVGPDTSIDKDKNVVLGSAALKFMAHPLIVEKLKLNDEHITSNIKNCKRAHGLAQSMGFNHVRKVSPWGSGPCVIEKLVLKYNFESSWTARLTINPGDSMAKIMGPKGQAFDSTFVTNQIMSGLMILNDKWNNTRKYSDGVRWHAESNGKDYINNSRLLVALGYYLGYSGKDAVNSTASSYVAAIMNKSYKEANGNLSSNLVSSSFEILVDGKPSKIALSENTRKSLGCTA
jgi:hypothetical protein